MQYDNFAKGPDLANGFKYDGAGNATFTEGLTGKTTGMSWDVNGDERDGHWAFDVLNVEQATQRDALVPDSGSTVGLLGMALSGLTFIRSRLQK